VPISENFWDAPNTSPVWPLIFTFPIKKIGNADINPTSKINNPDVPKQVNAINIAKMIAIRTEHNWGIPTLAAKPLFLAFGTYLIAITIGSLLIAPTPASDQIGSIAIKVSIADSSANKNIISAHAP